MREDSDPRGQGRRHRVDLRRQLPLSPHLQRTQSRIIFFEKGKAIGADLSQADGSQHFHATRKNDMYLIEAGHERYELIEALIYGG